MTRRQRWVARILLALYLAALIWLCFGRFNNLPDVPRSWWGLSADKVAHFLMFLPFPILSFFAFDRYTETLKASALYSAVTFFCGALFAACTEIGQKYLTSWRSGDPADFRADLLGLAAGTLLIFIIDLWKRRK